MPSAAGWRAGAGPRPERAASRLGRCRSPRRLFWPFLVVHELSELRQIEAESAGRRIWLMTTFPRALAIEYPELDGYVRREYAIVRTFPATVGDGEISVWSRRDGPSSS